MTTPNRPAACAVVIGVLAVTGSACRVRAPARNSDLPSGAVATVRAAWDIVNRTYFDPLFNGVDWARTGSEFARRAAGVTDRGQVRALIQQMLDRLGDSHALVVPESDSRSPNPQGMDRDIAQVAFEVRWFRDTLVVARSKAPDSGMPPIPIPPGSRVMAIDGEPAARIIAEADGLPPRRRALRVLQWAAARLRGPQGSSVVIDIQTPDRTLVRERIVRQPVRPVVAIPELRRTPCRATACGHRVAYIGFNRWELDRLAVIDRAIDDIADAPGLVIDLRGNLGGNALAGRDRVLEKATAWLQEVAKMSGRSDSGGQEQ